MRLLIDYRENKEIIEMVQNICKDSEIVTLPLGDFLIIKNNDAVVVERKNSADFVNSMRSNRLWEQLLSLMKTKEIMGYEIKRRILVVHGTFGDYLSTIPDYLVTISQRKLKAFWNSLVGAQLEILYVYDTPIVIAENDEAFHSFMKILIKREEEGKNDKTPEARWYRKRAIRDLPAKDRKLFFLSAIPSIGEKLAKNLLEHFGSIVDIATASVKELQMVPGIGKKKAENIFEIFR